MKVKPTGLTMIESQLLCLFLFIFQDIVYIIGGICNCDDDFTFESITVDLNTGVISEAKDMIHAVLCAGSASSFNRIVICGGLMQSGVGGLCQLYSPDVNRYVCSVLCILFTHKIGANWLPICCCRLFPDEYPIIKNTLQCLCSLCPLQTDTFLFPCIHSHQVHLSSNKLNSVMKDRALNTRHVVPPRGHLQGQTRDNSNTPFFTQKRNVDTCVCI